MLTGVCLQNDNTRNLFLGDKIGVTCFDVHTADKTKLGKNIKYGMEN